MSPRRKVVRSSAYCLSAENVRGEIYKLSYNGEWKKAPAYAESFSYQDAYDRAVVEQEHELTVDAERLFNVRFHRC